jgi:hypothetical protein
VTSHHEGLLAERKCGDLLAARKKAPALITVGGQTWIVNVSYQSNPPATLADLGNDWLKLAAVPEEIFEQALAETNPSTSGIIMRHEVAERGKGPVMNYPHD